MRILKAILLCIAIMQMAGVATAGTLKLEELIPKESWSRTGIARLSTAERDALASEIMSFAEEMLEYKRSGTAVVAPSVSTSMKAIEIRMEIGVPEVPLRQAESVLVVVRSSLYLPLSSYYSNVCELIDDAEAQLNIAGPNFHVYLYSMDDDLRVTQTFHDSFPVDDY